MPGSVSLCPILLIDDNPDHREIVASLLKEQASTGQVFASATGDAALAALGRHPRAVVLIHLLPPYERGLSMVCRVRQAYPAAKIAAFSSGPADRIDFLEPWDCLETARRLGADRVLLLPHDLRELGRAVGDLSGAAR